MALSSEMLTGTTTFICAECNWRMTTPLLGIAAAEQATIAHPGHVTVRESEPPRRRRRQTYKEPTNG